MARSEYTKQFQLYARLACFAAAGFWLASPLTGCVLVGGYRSGSGFFIWPGSLALFVVALLVVLLLRRRR